MIFIAIISTVTAEGIAIGRLNQLVGAADLWSFGENASPPESISVRGRFRMLITGAVASVAKKSQVLP